MDSADPEVLIQSRQRLAEKGRILYRKSCGTSGKRTCVESFALYHLGRGETQVVRDLLAFLERETEALRSDDPEGRLAITVDLATRIGRLADSGDGEPAQGFRGT